MNYFKSNSPFRFGLVGCLMAFGSVFAPGTTRLAKAETPPMVTSVQFSNPEPRTATKLTVIPIASDSNQGSLTFTYTWSKTVGTTVTALAETSDTLDLGVVGNGDFGDKISVTVTAHDGQLDSAPFTASETVFNSPPVIKSVTITPAVPRTNDTLKAKFEASDPDGDAFTYSFSWTNSSDYNTGPVQSGSSDTLDLSVAGHGDEDEKIGVILKAVDLHGASTSFASAKVLIANTNPVFPDATLSGSENHAISGRFWAVDPDGATQLQYQVQDRPKHGIADLMDLDKFVYTPKANWNGQDTFRIKVIDNAKGTSTALITVNVAPVNAAPTGVNDAVSGTEDTALIIPAATLLKNDINGEIAGETDALRIIAVKAAADFPGTLSLNVANQTLLFTPKANWNGTTSFTYTLEDSGKLTATATVTVKITAVNDVPVVSNASAKVLAGIPVDIALKGTDVEGDALSFALTSKPQHGSAKIMVDGANVTLHYLSNAGFSGVETLNFVARDAKSTSAAGTITITVIPNHAPRFMSLSPNAGTFTTGQTVQFEQRVRDQDGAENLAAVGLLFSDIPVSPTARNGAVLWYNPQTRQITLSTNDGKGTLDPLDLDRSLENGQVVVSLAESGVSTLKDGSLVLDWKVTFKAGYKGNKTLWSRVEDLSGASEGFSKVGQISIAAPAVTAPVTAGGPSAPAS